MLTSRLLGVMSKLDYPSATDSKNNKLIQETARKSRAGSDRAFKVIYDIIKVFSTFTGVVTQIEYLRRSSLNRNNIDLFFIGLIANFVKSAQWLFLGGKHIYIYISNFFMASVYFIESS